MNASLIALSLLQATHAWASPGDPYLSRQWSLKNDGTQSVTIQVDDLHTRKQAGAPGVDVGWADAREQVTRLAKAPVTVAVIDSGIDPTHPDLKNRITEGGYDFLAKSSNLMDTMGHGTHVSGIIAADADNGVGIAGIAPATVKILPLRILSDSFRNFAYQGKLISDYAADAIRYAVAHHAQIINMSLGWPRIVDSENARDAVAEAVKAGVLVVVAAGNDRKDQPTYPCSYEGVLCVGAVTNTGAMSIYSNSGGRVDILAPGDDILSTYPLDLESEMLRIQGYEVLSGTSQAAPEVAAVAAIIRSVYPDISLSELKARLLAGTRPLPGPDAALYGLVRIGSALSAEPEPVYLPEFKSLDGVVVDEGSLTASGAVSVSNLWKSADDVTAEVIVNGQSAGSVHVDQLAGGERIQVPWKYSFSALEDSSALKLTLKVTDSTKQAHEFTIALSAARAMENITSQERIEIPRLPNGHVPDWIGSSRGQLYSKIGMVGQYGTTSGLPQYYQQIGVGSLGTLIQIYDPSHPRALPAIQVPGIQQITQVMRLDVYGDGNLDWLVAGLGRNSHGTYFEFYFLDPELRPLSGIASDWRIQLDANYGKAIIRNYGLPGSWIRQGGKLVPCFLSGGILPGPDNFSPFDIRHYRPDTHLYYLAPKANSDYRLNGPIELEVRAVDNADFHKRLPGVHLRNLLPTTAEEQRGGHLRLLIGVGDGLDAKSMVWDLRSVTDLATQPAPGWDSLSSTGQAVHVQPGTSGAYLSFFDERRGSLAWATSEGQFVERTEFSFNDIGNPISGLIGAFSLPESGHVWFVASEFDLIAFHQKPGEPRVDSDHLTLDRDSTFATSQFSDLFTPILVGAPEHPLPGVYIDSTLVRGNRVSVAIWNPKTGRLEKPLRYSLRIPPGCVQMDPVHLDASPQSFALPLLCREGANLELDFVRPAEAR